MGQHLATQAQTTQEDTLAGGDPQCVDVAHGLRAALPRETHLRQGDHAFRAAGMGAGVLRNRLHTGG